jgi:hypothetical protein
MFYFDGKSPSNLFPSSGKSFMRKKMKAESFLLGPTGSGRTYSILAEQLKLIELAKEALDKGDVYFVDFTGDMNRYVDYLPGCQFCSSEDGFVKLISNLREQYEERIRSESPDSYSSIHLILYGLNNVPEETIKYYREFMGLVMSSRIAKFVIVVHSPGPEFIDMIPPER